MAFNSPLSTAKATLLIDQLRISSGDQVLDVGCGSGEFLVQLVAQTGAVGTGIDRDAEHIVAAEAVARDAAVHDSCAFRMADAAAAELEPEAYEAVVCIGATHAYGSGSAAYPTALQQLAELIPPGGRLLIGEGYWQQPPAEDYLALIGEPVGIYHDHAGNVALAETLGLIPWFACASSNDEWDAFEWRHRQRYELDALASPDDPAVLQALGRSHSWRDGYLRWGRATMGFGFYIFMKPPAVR